MGAAGICLIWPGTVLTKSLDVGMGDHVCHTYSAYMIYMFKYSVILSYYKHPMHYKYLLSSDQFRYSEIIHFAEKQQISKKMGKGQAFLADLLPESYSLYVEWHGAFILIPIEGPVSTHFHLLPCLSWSRLFSFCSLKEISGNQQNTRLPWDVRQIGT